MDRQFSYTINRSRGKHDQIQGLNFCLHPLYQKSSQQSPSQNFNLPQSSQIYDFSHDQTLLKAIESLQAQIEKEKISQRKTMIPSSSILEPTRQESNDLAVINFQKSSVSTNMTDLLNEFVTGNDSFNTETINALDSMTELGKIFNTQNKISGESADKIGASSDQVFENQSPNPPQPQPRTSIPENVTVNDIVNIANDQSKNNKNLQLQLSMDNDSAPPVIPNRSSSSSAQKPFEPISTTPINQKIEYTLFNLPNFSAVPELPQRSHSLKLASRTVSNSNGSSFEDVQVIEGSDEYRKSETSEQSENSNSETAWLKDYSGVEKTIAKNLKNMEYEEEFIVSGILIGNILLQSREQMKKNRKQTLRVVGLQNFVKTETDPSMATMPTIMQFHFF